MKATRFEYRFRFAIHAMIFCLGFWAPWLMLPALADTPGFTSKSTWLILSSVVARQGWLGFTAATVTLLVLALVFTGLGAWFRVWGTAYVGYGVVNSGTMHGDAMLVDGPYRRTRNPLYLGTLLHTIGIAILMPVSGAVFAVALMWILEIRLALAEEPFLAARFGAAYVAYKAAVPRFLPSPRAQVAAAGVAARWGQAVLGELYFVGAFVVLALFGWNFNALPIEQGLLVSLGAWIVAKAFLPRVTSENIQSPDA